MTIKNSDSKNREWLVKRVAEEAGFIKRDVDRILKIMEEILIDEIILENESFFWQGFFQLYVKTCKGHKGYNVVTGEMQNVRGYRRIVMSLSRGLLAKMKQYEKEILEEENNNIGKQTEDLEDEI